jgi:hypothetical protein
MNSGLDPLSSKKVRYSTFFESKRGGHTDLEDLGDAGGVDLLHHLEAGLLVDLHGAGHLHVRRAVAQVQRVRGGHQRCFQFHFHLHISHTTDVSFPDPRFTGSHARNRETVFHSFIYVPQATHRAPSSARPSGW